ncbi:MAG: hypothetical protein SVE93_03765 [Candidatus Thermoplasmatota archaeon]|nr:hypothetical protein [Candidatus Thermoplasmatota archaeon]
MRFVPLAVALLLLFTVFPVESQSVFDVRDKDVMQTLLGPFSHFFMPLLGFYSMRSFLLAPYYIVEDWISSAWPIGALILLILNSDLSTISSAMEDIRDSLIYRAMRRAYYLVVPARFEPALVTVLIALFSLLSSLIGTLMLCAGAMPGIITEGLQYLVALFSIPWFPCAVLFSLPGIRSIYLWLGNFIFSFVCDLIPGLRVLYVDFIEQATGIPMINVLY